MMFNFLDTFFIHEYFCCVREDAQIRDLYQKFPSFLQDISKVENLKKSILI